MDQVQETIVKGFDLERKHLWVLFVMYNNQGFRQLGAQASYNQYITILIQFISALVGVPWFLFCTRRDINKQGMERMESHMR